MISRNSGIQHSKLDHFHRGASHSRFFRFHRFVAIPFWEIRVEIVLTDDTVLESCHFIVDVGLDGTKRRLINDE